jgi:hypothetical protein
MLCYESSFYKSISRILRRQAQLTYLLKEYLKEPGLSQNIEVSNTYWLMGNRITCVGYLLHPSVFEKSNREFCQSITIFPSTKMFLKDCFQENAPCTSRQIQLDLISWSSIDTIHPHSSRSASIQISYARITVM